MEERLRAFLSGYIGQGELKRDKVTQQAVDELMLFAVSRHIEQEIIDYGMAHPDAPFWDFLELIPYDPEEDVDEEDDEDERL